MYIFLGTVAFVLMVLFCPVHLKMEFCESLKIKIRILFFNFTIFPKKAEEKKRTKKPKEAKELPARKKGDENKLKELIKQRGLKGFLNILKQMGKIILGVGKMVKSKVVVDDLSVLVSVSGEDSAATAVTYGKVCAGVFPFANIILNNFKVKSYDVKVFPNFMKEKPSVEFKLKLHLRLVTLIHIVLWAVIKLVKGLYLKPADIKN